MSRICEAIKGEFDAWKTRDLSEVELDDLVADGSYFTMHPGAPAEPVLVAWGITTPGRSVFLGLEPGSAERTDAWASCLRGLTARGFGDPLLLTSDGGAGLIGAAELGFPAACGDAASSTAPAPTGPRARGQVLGSVFSLRRWSSSAVTTRSCRAVAMSS